VAYKLCHSVSHLLPGAYKLDFWVDGCVGHLTASFYVFISQQCTVRHHTVTCLQLFLIVDFSEQFSQKLFACFIRIVLRKPVFVFQKGNVDVEEEEISGVITRQNRQTAWEHWKNGMLMPWAVALCYYISFILAGISVCLQAGLEFQIMRIMSYTSHFEDCPPVRYEFLEDRS